MVNGLVPPEPLGMCIRRLGLKLKDSLEMEVERSVKNSQFIPSRVSGVTPGVIFPGLLLMLLYANSRK